MPRLELSTDLPVKSYLEQTPSTDAGDRYNGAGYWGLPMPIVSVLERDRNDRVFYDGEGYAKVRDYLRRRGIRHVLLTGYATDMCVISTTCGWQNLSRDFNLFLVGDATVATFPAMQGRISIARTMRGLLVNSKRLPAGDASAMAEKAWLQVLHDAHVNSLVLQTAISVEDFPAPFAPSSATSSPRPTAKEAPRTARTAP